MIFLRKEQKDHGTQKIIEGNYNKNDKVVLIEDVTTTGDSVIDAAQRLEENGLIISQIITIFSRSDNLHVKYNNIPIEYLYHISDMTNKRHLTDIIKEKKTNICLAADVDNTQKLYKLIEQVGEDICILKIHSDIITDFYRDYKFNRNELNKLKLKKTLR